MTSKQSGVVEMDTELQYSRHEGGWYVYSNHVEHTETDPETGVTRTYYTADAVWQVEQPAGFVDPEDDLTAWRSTVNVDGADFRSTLQTHKVVDNEFVLIETAVETGLYTEIENYIQGIIDDGIPEIGKISMVNVLEQLHTKPRFYRNSQGITDMVNTLPMVNDDIADTVFQKAVELSQGTLS